MSTPDLRDEPRDRKDQACAQSARRQQQGVDIFQGLQSSSLPARKADNDGRRGADAPEQRVPHAGIVQDTADLAIHRQMDGQNHAKEYRE
jgi:hypothetical protein